MGPDGDLYQNEKVFGETMDEPFKCDYQDLLSDKYSLTTSGVHILLMAIYEVLKCDSIIFQSDKYSLVTHGGYLPTKEGFHKLVQWESVQNCGTRSEITSLDSLAVLKDTDDVCLVFEDGIKMVTINWARRDLLHKSDQDVQMLKTLGEERSYEHDMDQATKLPSKDKRMILFQDEACLRMSGQDRCIMYTDSANCSKMQMLERECYSTLEFFLYPFVDLRFMTHIKSEVLEIIQGSVYLCGDDHNKLLTETIRIISETERGTASIINCSIEICYLACMYYSQSGMFYIPKHNHEQLGRIPGMPISIQRIDSMYKCELTPEELYTNEYGDPPDWVLSPEGEGRVHVITSSWGCGYARRRSRRVPSTTSAPRIAPDYPFRRGV